MYRLARYAHSFSASLTAPRMTTPRSLSSRLTLVGRPSCFSIHSTSAWRTRGMHPRGTRKAWFSANPLMTLFAFWNASCRLFGGCRSSSVRRASSASAAPLPPAGVASS